MNIFLVRHAQSMSNVDLNVLKLETNVGIRLSETGVQQAKESGQFLADYVSLHCSNNVGQPDVKVWNSPYNRTRQTSQAIKSAMLENKISFVEEESIYIAERQFGLIDDVDEYDKHYAHETKHYKMHRDSKQEFFARPPLGESPFDMCMRLDFFLRTVLASEGNIKNHVIVSHGAAIRGLILMHQKQKYEEYNCPNPANASVRLLTDGQYCGEIFCPEVRTA